MFGSDTLEVAIGLVVLFSFLSLFATALREWIESLLKQRATLMHKALEELFSPGGSLGGTTIKEFYESVVISPLFAGAYNGRARNLPSYIPSSQCAEALLDIAAKQATLSGTQSNKRLADLIDIGSRAAGSDPDKLRQFLERFFDSQMDRVSGWYRRLTQFILLVIGLASAVLLNVDAVAVTQHLYSNDTLRQLIVAGADKLPQPSAASPAQGEAIPQPPRQLLNDIRGYGFPIGWAWKEGFPEPVPQCALHGGKAGCDLGVSGILMMALGWLITAFAVSLGAPFWFDVLNKIMVIRSTVKPFEKSQPEGSEDRQVVRAPAAPSVSAQAVPSAAVG